jgi:hypothetical protein
MSNSKKINEVFTMYQKDKLNRITLRLNEEQFGYVKENADVLGVSPSEFLRMVINSSMAIAKKAAQASKDAMKTFKSSMEEQGRENDKANIDNLV